MVIGIRLISGLYKPTCLEQDRHTFRPPLLLRAHISIKEKYFQMIFIAFSYKLVPSRLLATAFFFIDFVESIANSNNQGHWQIHIWSQFGA
jgi:hypothetical protein